MSKTPLMIQTEKENEGTPLEILIPQLCARHGRSHGMLKQVAADLGVSKATLAYWLLKLGIVIERVPVSPGESVKIERRQP